MEKYGVSEEQEELEKKAAQGCPNCGRKDLTKHGSLLFCPNCGSEPFEQERKHSQR
jgi:DNA-directed RNA polymerase subunit RPC12/RpoP